MKKIIILICLMFLLSGCMDYKEIDSLAYISAIGYDYVDDKFEVTYEIINNDNEEESTELDSHIITGVGKSNYDAHLNAGKKLKKTPSFSHTLVILISTNVIGDHLKELADFVLRNARLNGELNILITDDYTPKEILNIKNKESKVASFFLYDSIVNNDYNKSFALDIPFIKIASHAMSDKKDFITSVVSIEEEKFYLQGNALFDNYNIKYITNREEANIHKALIDKNAKLYLLNEIKDENLETLINFSKTNINVTAEKITFNIRGEAELKTVPDSINLIAPKSYQTITDKLEETVQKKITDYVNLLQKNKTDVLGFGNIYYIKTRQANHDLWTKALVDVNVKISIAKKGMITNVD